MQKLLIMMTLSLLVLLNFASATDKVCGEFGAIAEKSSCFLKLGIISQTHHKYENATKLFVRGISEVGKSYNNEHKRVDDTGQKLVLAQFEAKNANYKVASNLYKGILESRIQMLSINGQ